MHGEVKKDHSKDELNSPEVQGQGTTNRETGSQKMDSSRKKQTKRSGIL